MCGIAGIVSFKENIDAKYINEMTDVISYRGPDDEGAIIVNTNSVVVPFKRSNELKNGDRSGRLLLGHRRLSIIDLSKDGHQPMSYDNDKLWIIFNGEIYNYIELKDELSKYGYHFATKTDTEVLLAAYHKWGDDCVKRFNGMWSFAIYDAKKNKLFCSCDQQGIKPFYYVMDEDMFYFGSEIKQLLTLPFIDKTINKEFILNYLGYGIPENIKEITLFKKIKKLKTGYNIIINNIIGKNKNINTVKWHEYNFTKNINYDISEEQAVREFSDLFNKSVKIRLRSDVPIGTALSGGLDSSAILVTIDNILKDKGIKDKQKAFTAGSELDEINEINFAKEVANKTNSEHYTTIPSADGFIEDLKKMYYHIELPYGNSSCYAIWKTYELAKKNNVTVTIDGQGLDELMGGYDYFHVPYILGELIFNRRYKELYYSIKDMHAKYDKNYFKLIKDVIRVVLKNIPNLYNKHQVNHVKNSKLLNPTFKNEALKIIDHNRNIKSIKLINLFKNNLRNFFYVISLPSILMTVDRISMAHSIEARLPYLDPNLIDCILTFPSNYKIRNSTTKYIARKSFKKLLPKSILGRKKLGFVTAESLWLAEKKKEVSEIITRNRGRFSGIFSSSEIDNMLEHDSGSNIDNLLWKVLSISVIFEIFDLNV